MNCKNLCVCVSMFDFVEKLVTRAERIIFIIFFLMLWKFFEIQKVLNCVFARVFSGWFGVHDGSLSREKEMLNWW